MINLSVTFLSTIMFKLRKKTNKFVFDYHDKKISKSPTVIYYFINCSHRRVVEHYICMLILQNTEPIARDKYRIFAYK